MFSLPAFGEVEVLLKSTTSWDGGSFQYPQGSAEITVARVTLEEGQETPLHCHPVPTFGYLVKGTLEVRTGAGKSTLIREGEAAIEVMRTLHRGRAVGGPVEILVFYAGAVDLKNTLPHESSACRQ